MFSEMNRFLLDLVLVVVSAALGAVSRYSRLIATENGLVRGECCAIHWKAVALETPGVIVCGVMAGGLCYAVGLDQPLILMGVASFAGHVGMAVFVGLVLRFVEPLFPKKPPKAE